MKGLWEVEKRKGSRWGVWLTAIIPALRSLRQDDDHKVRANTGYRVTLSQKSRLEMSRSLDGMLP